MSQRTSLTLWRLCCLGFVVLSIVVFSPMVIPPGVYEPSWLGMPLTLGRGLMAAGCFVLLAILGSLVQPVDDEETN